MKSAGQDTTVTSTPAQCCHGCGHMETERQHRHKGASVSCAAAIRRHRVALIVPSEFTSQRGRPVISACRWEELYANSWRRYSDAWWVCMQADVNLIPFFYTAATSTHVWSFLRTKCGGCFNKEEQPECWISWNQPSLVCNTKTQLSFNTCRCVCAGALVTDLHKQRFCSWFIITYP